MDGALLLMLPDDIMVYDVWPYLSDGDIVRGLSEVNKNTKALCRNKYKVKRMNVYPYERVNTGWKRIFRMNFVPTPWGRRKTKFEELMNGIKKNSTNEFRMH